MASLSGIMLDRIIEGHSSQPSLQEVGRLSHSLGSSCAISSSKGNNPDMTLVALNYNRLSGRVAIDQP